MAISKFNAEGYPDPTTYEAVRSIETQESVKFPFRSVVYICSPLAGDIVGNQKKARRYCRFAVEQGVIPLAPHLLFPQFMDDSDPEERELAMFMDLVLLSKCAELWVFGERVSNGMKLEIEKARKNGKLVRYFSSDYKEVSA